MYPWKGPGDKAGLSAGIFSAGVDTSAQPPPPPPKLVACRSATSKQERARLAAGLPLVSFLSDVAVTPAENQGAQEPQDLGAGPGGMAPGSPQAPLQLPERALGRCGPRAASFLPRGPGSAPLGVWAEDSGRHRGTALRGSGLSGLTARRAGRAAASQAGGARAAGEPGGPGSPRTGPRAQGRTAGRQLGSARRPAAPSAPCPLVCRTEAICTRGLRASGGGWGRGAGRRRWAGPSLLPSLRGRLPLQPAGPAVDSRGAGDLCPVHWEGHKGQ